MYEHILLETSKARFPTVQRQVGEMFLANATKTRTMTKKFCWDKIPFFFNVNRMSIAITGHKNYLHGHVNVRGLGGCGHFSTIFVSFKGRARYKDVEKTQILELDTK